MKHEVVPYNLWNINRIFEIEEETTVIKYFQDFPESFTFCLRCLIFGFEIGVPRNKYKSQVNYNAFRISGILGYQNR